MTASVLKQDPNSWKVQMNAIYLLGQNKKPANVRVNPLCEAPKRHLNNTKQSETWSEKLNHLSVFVSAMLFSCPVFPFPNTGQKNHIAQPKTNKWFSFFALFFIVSDRLAVV